MRLNSAIARWVSLDNVVMMLLLLSVGINVSFAYAKRASASTQQRYAFVPGSLAPPLVVDAIGGERRTVVWDDDKRPTLLYFFTTTCEWCDRNVESIKALSSQLGTKYRVVMVSLNKKGLEKYASTKLEGVEVYSMPTPVARAGYGLGPTPHTVVVGNMGEVKYAWMGAYDKSVTEQLRAWFGVDVPPVDTRAAGVRTESGTIAVTPAQ
jgi:thiol-disulfide isomerase/thioredoxin